MITKEQKIDCINYAKAIGIIAVVIGHYKNDMFDVFKPYMYHMPLFFFIGGILHNDKRSITNSILTTIKKHHFYIVVNYILIGIFIIAVNNSFGTSLRNPFDESIIGTIKYAVTWNFHSNTLFLVAWFLFAYSLIFVLFSVIINKITKGKLPIFLISIFLGVIGYYVAVEMYAKSELFYLNLLSQVLVGSMFYGIGVSIKDGFFSLLNPFAFVVILIAILTLVKLDYIGTIGMSWSNYNKGLFNLLFTPVACIYCVFFVSYSLSKSSKFKTLLLIGMNTKSIMSYHLAAFVILDIFFSYIGKYEISNISALNHFNTYKVWVIYVLFSIFASIYCEKICMHLKDKILAMAKRALLN
ncbi:TPA: acyltransferase family protein [Morganella morganii subsp. morganii]|nr:acyltransferase family protein [Morganella morganii subsp. morganii]